MTTFSLSSLHSFGDVAAEDDAVLDYFLKTDAVSRIQDNRSLLVLGRKGAGKTALVRYFAEGGGSSGSSVSLRGYPWNVHSQRIDHGASEIEAYVSSWRYLIALEFALLAAAKNPHTSLPEARALQKFLDDNYGGKNPALADVLKPSKLRFSGASFEPEVLGFKLGSIDFDRQNHLGLGGELNALSDLLLQAAGRIASAQQLGHISLHIDELDHGLTVLDDNRSRMLVGL